MIERLQTTPEYTTRTTCRSCSSGSLETILDLGKVKLPSFSVEDSHVPAIPLELCRCGECSLVQLKHSARPDLLWNDNYGYRSGVNSTMSGELASIVEGLSQRLRQKANWSRKEEDRRIVVDIGCNDGTLLSSYPQTDLIRVGFDPSSNLAPYFRQNLARMGEHHLFEDFFNARAFKEKYGDQKARVITAIAMFYDLEDPNAFLEDVREILDPDGTFVIQQNYLVGMLEQNAYDNIVHEHHEFYSLLSLDPLIRRHGMEIYHVMENDINGGSIRTYIRHQGSEVDQALYLAAGAGREALERKIRKELMLGLDKPAVYQAFADRIKKNNEELTALVKGVVAEGKKVYVYGASTRGNTILQVCGLDKSLIAGAAERNPDKWGKKIGSVGIPIVSEAEARDKADYFLVLPWFFKEEFVKREEKFRERGGKLIFPLPNLQVI